VPLRSASLVCFFTDGLLEARAGEEMIGRARLTEMVGSLGPDDQAEAVLARVVAAADEASDDMAVCLVRPLTSAGVGTPRTEVLELGQDDLETDLAERFLEACGLSDGAVAAASDRARGTVRASGGALIEVTIPGRDALGGAEDLLVHVLAADGDAQEAVVRAAGTTAYD
jgi:Stage II sporulation protein E (SpoIIE)